MIKFYKYLTSILVLVLSACYPAPKVSGQFTDQEFKAMADKMAEGKTPDITVEELIRNKDQFIILDAREKKEYQVSHIPGAVWVGYDDFSKSRIPAEAEQKKVVIYCSVGYRSERIGEKILEDYPEVFNLNGSIFRWANEGYKMEDQNGNATTHIHGYNKKWSKWIKQGHIVY